MLSYRVFNRKYSIINLVMLVVIASSVLALGSDSDSEDKKNRDNMKNKKKIGDQQYNRLTPEEEAIIVHKGTEQAFSGQFYKHSKEGSYLCKRCDAKLFESDDKFDSECGWPSFDDVVPGAVSEQLDADGRRTEIVCTNCGGHLGHVFQGEKLTDKNTRHCVNSLSLSFASEIDPPTTPDPKTARAFFAGGCFWGTDYFLKKEPGVVSTRAGYMGGHTDNPDYKSVCNGNTGHAETVEVVFEPSQTTYEKLARLFFEIHDPTQVNRQGPDIGDQYRSAVFYADDEQKEITQNLIELLEQSGFRVVTEVTPADKFWPAEEYHQDYYNGSGQLPYCHAPMKRFKD